MKLRNILVFFIIIFSLAFKHPFYLGVVDLKYSAKDKALQGSVKLFTNDFEAALKKKHNKTIDLINGKDKEENNKLLFIYLQQHLKLKINDKTIAYKLIGYEHEAEATWMYIEFEKSEIPKKVEVENTLLYDFLKEQINIVHLEIEGTKKSLKIACPEKVLKFDF